MRNKFRVVPSTIALCLIVLAVYSLPLAAFFMSENKNTRIRSAFISLGIGLVCLVTGGGILRNEYRLLERQKSTEKRLYSLLDDRS